MEDPLDELAGAPRERVWHWMERKARLADGTRPGWVLTAPDTVRTVVRERRLRGEPPPVGSGRTPVPSWDIIEAGALRAFSGLTHEEVALRLSIPRGTARERIHGYSACFQEGKAFRAEVAGLLHDCLRRDFPRRPRSWALVASRGWATPAPRVRRRVSPEASR
jgi:hypothetical protein